MGILEDLLGSGKPVTPGLLDAAGYMDPAQYDRARRSSAMDGLWAGLLAGGAPSLTPRNFFSALGTGMQGRQQYATDFDKDQFASSQAAAQRALIPQRQLELEQKRDALKLVGEKLPQLLPGYGGAGGGAAGAAPGAGGGGGGAGGGAGGGGREVASMTADSTLPPEARGLLDTIAGPESAGAYNIRYTPKGGATFDGYDAHPRIAEPGPQGPSTAAGRYQIVASTFDPLAAKYGFKDFKPETQDQAAWHLAQDTYRQKTGGDLLADLQAGKTDRVQSALSGQWATLRMENFGANVEKYSRASAVAANEIPDVGTRSLDQANLPSIRAPGDPRVTQAFPNVPSYAGALGETAAPLPGAVAGGPRPAPAPGLTVLGAPVDRAYQLNAMTPQQQHEANLAAGGRGIFPPGQKFNRNGSPISPDLTATLPGQQSGANIPPEVARSLGRRADAGGPDTVVAAGPLPPVPGLPGGPAAAGGPAAMQLAALVSGGAGGQLRPGAAPGGGDTVVPPGPLPAAPATPAPAPAATQPPAGTLVPGTMPATPTPAEQAIVPRPDLVPQPGVPERPTLTPAPAARPLPALPPAPGLTTPDFSQVGQAVPADVARRAGIALQVGLGLKILGLDVPAISKIAELPLELQKTAYEAAVKAPYELRNQQYTSLLNMNTEQWKNLSENDRTLWSAALGLDKTEFEARIRQSEKGVEEQNKQINQNWANMTDAEKAKAAASNQFANTKFQAEMEQYGKWNSPTEVKEYDPVTGAVQVRTSTPAMEYQREIARTGGPQGLTVGQALQTPRAQQGPAPAPGATQPPPGAQAPAQTFAPAPAPGATPIPLRPGGAFIRGELGPGAAEELKTRGTELGKLDARIGDEATQAGTNLSDLRVMQTSAQQLALQGPFAGWAQGVNRVINSLTGEQAARVAANELVTKNSERLIRDTVRQSDSQPAAIQLSMTRNSMPTAATSKQGFAEVMGQMTGAEEWRQYRGSMAEAYKGVRGTLDGFQNWLPVSPHAFMVDSMPEVFKQQLFQRLQSGGSAGQAEARALRDQIRLLEQWRASRTGG